jgi:hypothetical protein
LTAVHETRRMTNKTEIVIFLFMAGSLPKASSSSTIYTWETLKWAKYIVSWQHYSQNRPTACVMPLRGTAGEMKVQKWYPLIVQKKPKTVGPTSRPVHTCPGAPSGRCVRRTHWTQDSLTENRQHRKLDKIYRHLKFGKNLKHDLRNRMRDK